MSEITPDARPMQQLNDHLDGRVHTRRLYRAAGGKETPKAILFALLEDSLTHTSNLDTRGDDHLVHHPPNVSEQ